MRDRAELLRYIANARAALERLSTDPDASPVTIRTVRLILAEDEAELAAMGGDPSEPMLSYRGVFYPVMAGSA